MSHKKLRPFIVKVSLLGYFPLATAYFMRICFLISWKPSSAALSFMAILIALSSTIMNKKGANVSPVIHLWIFKTIWFHYQGNFCTCIYM